MIEKDIFSKTVRRMFGLSLHTWENLMVGSLVAAALAAVAVVVATYAVVQLQRLEIADSKDEFERYKLSAGQSIAEAGARAAEANQKASESREETAKAFKEAAGANERAGKLEMEAAAARLETEKLKSIVAWRSLSSQEASEMGKVLSAKPGSVNLRYMDGDPEALFLAIQISKILERSHWKIAAGAVKPANGIVFGVNLPEADNPDRQTLREALSAAHIPFGSQPIVPGGVAFSLSTIPGGPTLMIGSKAPTFP